MATTQPTPDTIAEQLGFRPIPELDGVRDVWPRGARLRAVREGAIAFKERFKAQGEVTAVRSFDIATAPYPVLYGFHGAVKGISPLISMMNRELVVQYEDFEGRSRILVWEPTVSAGSAEAPYYAKLAEQGNEKLAKIWTQELRGPADGLREAGLRPEDVDFASFDHVHVQDMRMLLGTTDGAYVSPLPNATFLVQDVEWDTLEDTHPMQRAWYVPDGGKDVHRDRLALLHGDVELGRGVAIVRTPGHTDGNHSLVINTPDGVWVSSENGISIDNWQPELSKIPGLRKHAAFFEREVVPNANTLEDALDQYDSMVLEKTLADASKRDPRFKQVLPSSELVDWKRFWPVRPTHFHGGIAYGRFDLSAR